LTGPCSLLSFLIKMDSACDSNDPLLSQYKQAVFGKLSALGMPHGDAAAVRHLWKIVNVCVKLGVDKGAQSLQSEKLVKAVSRELTAPCAQLFTKWLTAQIQVYFAKELALPLPTAAAHACKSEVKVEAPGSDDQGARAVAVGLKEPLCPQPSDIRSVPTPLVYRSLPAFAARDQEHEAWVETKSSKGKTYFWDRRTSERSWVLPAGVKAKWTSHNAGLDGRTYFSDCSGKIFYQMPPLTQTAFETVSGEMKSVPAAANSSFFLPEVGLVELVQLPPAPKQSTFDLGPFEAVFPLEEIEIVAPPSGPCPVAALSTEPQKEEEPETPMLSETPAFACRGIEAVKVGSKVLQSTQSLNLSNDSSSKPCEAVLSLREELALLRKQLSDMGDSPPAPKSPPSGATSLESSTESKLEAEAKPSMPSSQPPPDDLGSAWGMAAKPWVLEVKAPAPVAPLPPPPSTPPPPLGTGWPGYSHWGYYHPSAVAPLPPPPSDQWLPLPPPPSDAPPLPPPPPLPEVHKELLIEEKPLRSETNVEELPKEEKLLPRKRLAETALQTLKLEALKCQKQSDKPPRARNALSVPVAAGVLAATLTSSPSVVSDTASRSRSRSRCCSHRPAKLGIDDTWALLQAGKGTSDSPLRKGTKQRRSSLGGA